LCQQVPEQLQRFFFQSQYVPRLSITALCQISHLFATLDLEDNTHSSGSPHSVLHANWPASIRGILSLAYASSVISVTQPHVIPSLSVFYSKAREVQTETEPAHCCTAWRSVLLQTPTADWRSDADSMSEVDDFPILESNAVATRFEKRKIETDEDDIAHVSNSNPVSQKPTVEKPKRRRMKRLDDNASDSCAESNQTEASKQSSALQTALEESVTVAMDTSGTSLSTSSLEVSQRVEGDSEPVLPAEMVSTSEAITVSLSSALPVATLPTIMPDTVAPPPELRRDIFELLEATWLASDMGNLPARPCYTFYYNFCTQFLPPIYGRNPPESDLQYFLFNLNFFNIYINYCMSIHLSIFMYYFLILIIN
jgi:hypothetical protein